MDAETIDRIVELSKPEVVAVDGYLPFLVGPGRSPTSLEEFSTDPTRVRQTVNLTTPESFIDYVKNFALAETSVFADEVTAKFEAAIDYHATPLASSKELQGSRVSHIALYTSPKSREYEIWIGKNDAKMSQAEFAEFIEDNYADIVRPSHADMLEVSTGLQVAKSVEFQQATRLSDGRNEFKYAETVNGEVKRSGTGTGKLAIPETFSISIPVFRDGERHQFEARFRYRLNGGALTLFYQLHRPQVVYDAAVRVVSTKIKEGLPAAAFYFGQRSR